MSDRELSFAEAVREATDQAMQLDARVILVGQGTRDAGGIFGTVTGLFEQYGPERVIEMPLSENAITGICMGAALDGLRPLLVLQRADFLFLVMDQLVNHASKWRFMFGGRTRVPLTIRCIVGKGWGQGPQHSQSPHGALAHFPGLRIVTPASAYDAKGLLLNAIFSDDPVLVFEGRSLHSERGTVPVAPYVVPFGRATILREGTHVTLAAVSFMVPEAKAAAEALERRGVSVELVDVVSISPIDYETLEASTAKTGRLVIVDSSWAPGGIAAEISAEINQRLFGKLRAPIARVSPPFWPAPTAATLEKAYYPGAEQIAKVCLELVD